MKHTFKKSVEILFHDYELRKNRNPRFSKRAYANALGLSSGRLTDILSQRSPLAVKSAMNIAKKLVVPAHEQELFVALVENEQVDRRQKKLPGKSKRLNLDEFAIISDWEYFAFMALIETSVFKSEIPWIAKKLGISVQRAREIIDHLLSHNFITKDEAGNFANVHNSLSTITDIPSEILQKANISCILSGVERMSTVGILERDVTSLTLPINVRKMPALKSLIRDFKAKAAALMKDEPTDEVYNLNIQLVPVTQIGE
ncbi:MAG: DUF4423 domain-containing protein [Bdellovibrio sp.]